MKTLLFFSLVCSPSFAYNCQEKEQENGAKLVIVRVVSGVFWDLDQEKRIVAVALDKKGQVLENIHWENVKSVYLIQGRPERLSRYLKYGVSGGGAGLASVFLPDLIFGEKDGKKKEDGHALSLINILMRSSTGSAAGLVVAWLRGKGEEVRSFPIYDPEIKQDENRPAGWLNYADMRSLQKLTSRESIVVVTKKE